MGLLLTTHPTVEPVSVDEVRAALSVTDSDHDAHLSKLVRAARRRAEAYTYRAFISQAWRLTLDRFPSEIWLPRPPLLSVTNIQYVDTDGVTQTVASSVYRVTANSEPARVTVEYNQTWPTPRNVTECVTINYTAGYGTNPTDVPEEARQAIILMAGEWFDHPANASDGMPVKTIPHNAEWLLNSLRLGKGVAWAGLPAYELVSK